MPTIDEDDSFYADRVRETRTVMRGWKFAGLLWFVSQSDTIKSYKIIKEED